MCGIIVGTSSFIFIASPALLLFLGEKRLRAVPHEVAMKSTRAAHD